MALCSADVHIASQKAASAANNTDHALGGSIDPHIADARTRAAQKGNVRFGMVTGRFAPTFYNLALDRGYLASTWVGRRLGPFFTI